MSIRRIPLTNKEFYHVFNRGVDKRRIFMNQNDIRRFFQSMSEFNTIDPIGSIFENSFRKAKLGGGASKSGASKSERSNRKLVKIICFCLNPNHYHLILKQATSQGVEKFIHKLATGYTRYFNLKHQRSGVLFQGPFKAVHIKNNEQLLHTSVYVNLNFKIHQLGGGASKSSWDEYIGKTEYNFCQKEDIIKQFKNRKDYEKYAMDTLPGIISRKELLNELE